MRWNSVNFFGRFWRIRTRKRARRFASRGVARAYALDGLYASIDVLKIIKPSRRLCNFRYILWMSTYNVSAMVVMGVHTRTIPYRSVHLARATRLQCSSFSSRISRLVCSISFQKTKSCSARVLGVRVDGLAHGINTHVHQRFCEGSQNRHRRRKSSASRTIHMYIYSKLNQKVDPPIPNRINFDDDDVNDDSFYRRHSALLFFALP